MNSISVVIITRNEENNIVECIRSARLISTDIIVVDSGSDDRTVALSETGGASVFSIEWRGYGFSRNYGASRAKNNWILALDADERIGTELAGAIQNIHFSDTRLLYKFRRKNFLANKEIKYGTLGFETVTRIYNRLHGSWDLTLVHEKLIVHRPKKIYIDGTLIHFGLKNYDDFRNKAVLYAQMSAEKYFLEGKKTNLLKRVFSPLFNAAKSYIFQFGFLEGRQGWLIARNVAYYSWLKYFYLQQILDRAGSKELEFVTPVTARKIETANHG